MPPYCLSTTTTIAAAAAAAYNPQTPPLTREKSKTHITTPSTNHPLSPLFAYVRAPLFLSQPNPGSSAEVVPDELVFLLSWCKASSGYPGYLHVEHYATVKHSDIS